MLFSPLEILETIKMFQQEHLDIRTITMGISLRDCSTGFGETTRTKIYDKITRLAGNLVSTGENISNEFGIPIINKRIAVTPISLVAESSGVKNYSSFAKTLDKAAKETGVNFIGGFSALVEKGCTSGDTKLINSIPEALSSTERVCSSLNLGTSRTGINMDTVGELGHIIKKTAELTADDDGIGCAKLVVMHPEIILLWRVRFMALVNRNARLVLALVVPELFIVRLKIWKELLWMKLLTG